MADEVGVPIQIQSTPRHDQINANGNEVQIQDRESHKQAVTVVGVVNDWFYPELDFKEFVVLLN
jgi:hypothetical protein